MIEQAGWFYPRNRVGVWVGLLRILVIGAVIAILMGGCDGLEKKILTEKRLPYVLPDGSFGIVLLDHKVNAMMIDKQRKINLTYYIIDHYPAARLQSEAAALLLGAKGIIQIQFYDKNRNALVPPLNDGFRPDSLAYDDTAVVITGEEGWAIRWKGILPEDLLTFESFCDVDLVKATKIEKR